jgi:ribosomal protein L1
VLVSSALGGPKGQNVKSLYVSTTMGPGIRLDMADFRKGA